MKDRIKEFRRVKASSLFANPSNWREHPAKQCEALKGILEDVGFAGAILCRELPDKSLEIIDGHLRKETLPDQELPCLITDLNEDEAKELLAVLDPIGAMATTNKEALQNLLDITTINSEALQDMLNMKQKVKQELEQQNEERYAVLVECESDEHQRRLLEQFEKEGLSCRALIV
jgi:ParB-like chromosome segregation protein Spo0J